MPSKYLEDGDRVIRYVPWGKLRKDENDNVLGTIGEAFHLREGEEYLSVTWCDYFAGGPEGDIRCAVEAIRGSRLKVSPKGHFALATKAAIAAHMTSGGRKLRFVHERADDNEAHAAVRGWSNDDLELLERLAETVWHTVYSKSDIDQIQCSDCVASSRGAA